MKSWSKRKKIFSSLALLLVLCGAGAAFALRSGNIGGMPIKLYLKKKAPDAYNLIRSYILAYDIDTPGVAKRMNLPLFELQISKRDMEHFKKLHESMGHATTDVSPEYYVKNNTWKHAWLKYGGERYRVKIRSHARNPSNHDSWSYISLAVNLQDGREIDGSDRFNLIVRTHIQPIKQITFDLAKRFGVLANEEQPVRVRINGGHDKIFYLDRKLSDKQMESDGRSSFHIFGYSESDAKASVKSSILPLEFYDEQKLDKYLNKTLVDAGYPDKARISIYDRYLDINRAVLHNSYEDVDKFFDLDYISSFDAVRTIIREPSHGFYIANMFVFIDTASGKFYPVFTRDDIATKFKTGPDFSVEQQTNFNPRHILALVSRNDKIRQEKYKKIYRFIREQGDTINADQRKAVETRESMSFLGLFQKISRKLGFYDTDIASYNLGVLKKYIEESKPEAEMSLNGNRMTVSLNPKSMAALKFTSLGFAKCAQDGKLHHAKIVFASYVTGKPTDARAWRQSVYCDADGLSLIGLVENETFFTSLGEKLEKAKSEYILDFTFEDGMPAVEKDSFQIKMKNTVTGSQAELASSKWLEDPKPFYDRMSGLNVKGRPDKLMEFLKTAGVENIAISQKGEVVLQKGKYEIVRDLILPDGAPLVIEAGATLLLGREVLVSGNNGIIINGTATEPVVITSLDPQEPFGSVGILGDKKTSRSDVNNLIISNGFERWRNGAYFSGSLSIHYNASVTVRNTLVMRGHSDDGMNIKYSDDVTLDHNQFVDNSADQVDFDYCKGVVKNNLFRKTIFSHDNGDGLDVSGSRIIAMGNTFNGLGDKGVSVGEDSYILLYNNTFIHNVRGVAAKDLSESFFAGNRFDRNETDIVAYEKKAIFGGGNVYLLNEKRGSIPTIRTDNRSHVIHVREVKGLENSLSGKSGKINPEKILNNLLSLVK